MIRNKRRYYRSINKIENRSMKKYMFCIIVFTMLLIGFNFIQLGYNYEKNIKPMYTYTVEKSANYEVLLKENTFYETPKLPAELYYASKSIDSFIINFNYNFKGDKSNNINYSYNVSANLIGTVKGSDNIDREIWNKSFELIPNKTVEQADNNFSINEQVNIDYETYNSLARSYEREYGIIIEPILKVYLNVSYNIDGVNLDDENEKNSDSIELEIPVTTTITNVKKNYEDITVNNVTKPIEEFEINRDMYYITGAGIIIGTIIMATIKIKKDMKQMTKEEKYNRNINHIIKYYKELIVTVTNEPNIINLKIMNIAILEDLIDLAEQNASNIILYESVKNEKSNLYVIVGDYAYIYEVTDKEIK